MDKQIEGLSHLENHIETMKLSGETMAGIERLESMIAELMKTKND